MKKVFLFLNLLWVSTVSAYNFGRNKIQYRDFSWRSIETEHFVIYYYIGGENIAQFAAWDLEKTYKRYENLLGHKINGKTPVIIYTCHKDFQQTNVILDIIPEGVGGFTEEIKRRVVVPFTGSYRIFKHVLEHELVHVFQYDILFGSISNPFYIATSLRVPLWVMEGMAEFYSEGWSPEAESFMRDLFVNSEVVPIYKLQQYYGYINYKEGEAIFKFLSENYGIKKVANFFYTLKLEGSVAGAFKKTFGMSMDYLEEQFEAYYKKRFYPLLSKYDIPTTEKQITNHRKDGSFMNVKPTLSPDGKYLIFISDKSGYEDIYLASPVTGRLIKKLVSGQKKPQLENLHLLIPGLAFSKDSKYFAFTSQGGKTDILNIYDMESRKIVHEIPLKSLDAAYRPAWSPDGKTIALMGLKNGQSDIYLFDLEARDLKRLTSDIFEDIDPEFISDSEIIFVSEYNPDSLFGKYAVFLMNIRTFERKRLTPYLPLVKEPYLIGDSMLVFIGLLGGVPNILAYNLKTQNFYAVTKYLTGILDFSIAGDYIAFNLLWKSGYDIFIRKLSSIVPEPVLPDSVEGVFSSELTPGLVKNSKVYHTKFSIDFLQGGLAYVSPFGIYGNFTIGLSDALGNHRIFFTSDMFQDLQTSNFDFQYLYLPKRTDLGFEFYQEWNAYLLSENEAVLERDRAILGIAYYPFDVFTRLELGMGYATPIRYRFSYDPLSDRWSLVSRESFKSLEAYVGLVFDNALYTWFYPVDGTRFFIGASKTFLDLNTTILFGDFRQYFRLGKSYSFATRFIGGKAWGPDALPFWLGGPTTLRGYDYYEIVGTNMLLTNLELRIPFIERLKIAFPFGFELSGIRGTIFLDMGYAWFDYEKPRFFETGESGFKLKDLKADVGVGLRFNLRFVNLKFDMAKKTDFTGFSKETRYYLTLGQDF